MIRNAMIGLALVFAVPLSGCQTLLAGQSAQVQQVGVKSLIVAEQSYTLSVKIITSLVESGTLKGAALTKVLKLRDKARAALDVGDGTAAVSAAADLALAVGAAG